MAISLAEVAALLVKVVASLIEVAELLVKMAASFGIA